MALAKSLGWTWAGSYSTVAVLVARLTLARLTPGAVASVRSMVRAQAAQVMPDTGRSTRSAAAIFMPALRSQVAGRHPPADPVAPGPHHIPPWRWHLAGRTELW